MVTQVLTLIRLISSMKHYTTRGLLMTGIGEQPMISPDRVELYLLAIGVRKWRIRT